MTLEQAIAAYLDHLRLGRSPETVRTYGGHLRKFLKYAQEYRGWEVPQHLPPKVLVMYWTDTHRPPVAGVRAFLRWLSINGHHPNLNYEAACAALSDAMGRSSYTSPKVDRRLGDIIRVAEALPTPIDPKLRLAYLRDVAILRVLFCTGMRRAEVAGLDNRDFDGMQAIIKGKGGKERTVFFDEPAFTAIACYLVERGGNSTATFLAHHHGAKPGQRISPQTVWAVVKKYSELAGVLATPHKFRHHLATTMLNKGADLSTIQDVLGHASPDTTKRIYSRYDAQTLRRAVDQYGPKV
jgi:site-specific recombinase XerD